MMPTKNISSKICFVGDGGVGKTSLIGRYVYDMFDNKYLKTIGTKVTRKEILLDFPAKNVKIKMNAMIWDIMGQKAFRKLLHEAYFKGAQGILGVCSCTEKASLANLNEWIDSVIEVVGEVPVVILANKKDLKDDAQFCDEELREIAAELNAKSIFTSAKTGENVPKAFLTIAKEMIKNQLNIY